MSDELDEFFRCLEDDERGGWVFEVGVVAWDGPYMSHVVWQPFRRWRTAPDESRFDRARAAAVQVRRFFRTCKFCHELTNSGCMHDRVTCHGCAEQYLRVIH